MIRFDVGFNLRRQRLQTHFELTSNIFPVVFDKFVAVTKDVESYDGEYKVTPKVTEQVLPTAKKFMNADVTVAKIPIYDVSNNSGGTTVYIADNI